MKRKFIVIPTIVLTALMGGVACSSGGQEESVAPAVGGADSGTGDEDAATEGVHKFGETITFKDGSTLTVGKPTTFKRDKWAAGGENKRVFLKFKSTFVNRTKEVFDPALTTGSASSNGTEAESVYQDGLDAPDNKVLPGKSVTWWMGYGFDSNKDVQLEISMGFLDYDTIIFTR